MIICTLCVFLQIGRHLETTISSVGLSLTGADLASIEAVLAMATGPSGPVYGLERDREGAHGEIMKYNLNCLNQAKHLEELCTRSVCTCLSVLDPTIMINNYYSIKALLLLFHHLSVPVQNV